MVHSSQHCAVCMQLVRKENLLSLACQHQFCRSCWEQHCTVLVKDGVGVGRCKAMGHLALLGYAGISTYCFLLLVNFLLILKMEQFKGNTFFMSSFDGSRSYLGLWDWQQLSFGPLELPPRNLYSTFFEWTVPTEFFFSCLWSRGKMFSIPDKSPF